MAGKIYPELKEVSVDSLKLAVSSFFKALTDSQWANLKSDNPDHETKIQLMELLCDVAEQYTLAILCNSKAKSVELKHVAARLGHTVSESFAEVLGVREAKLCLCSGIFNNLFASHVFHIIKFCCCSDPDNHTEEDLQELSDFQRIDSMVCQGAVMIREFIILRDECHIATEEIAPTDSQIMRIFDGGQAEQSLSSVQTEEKSNQKPKKKGIMRSIKKFFSKHFLKRSVPPPRPLVENTAAENLPKVTQEVFGTHRKSNIDADVGELDEGVGSVKSIEDDKNGECIQVKDFPPQKQFMRLTHTEDALSDDDLSKTSPVENETQQRFTDMPPVEEMPDVETSVDRFVETFRSESLSGLIHVTPCKPQPQLRKMSPLEDEPLDGLAMEESKDEIPEIPLGKPQKFCEKSGECVVAEGNFKVESPLPVSFATPVEVFEPETEPSEVEGFTSEQGADVDTTYVRLLVGTMMTQAIEESVSIFSLEECQLVEERLFDRFCAALGRRDFEASPDSMNKLNGKFFKSLCKALGCSKGVLLLVMFLNAPGTDDAIVSCFMKKVQKVEKKPRSLKQAFGCFCRAVRKLFLIEEAPQTQQKQHEK